jgi:glycosyltransferase involved in cell wall biosynthesis
MKLAILGTRGIPARYGGFETFAEKLAAGLAQSGVDVTVFCEARKSASASLWQGIHLRYVPAPPLGSLKTILYDIECLWKARHEYDVVYMLGYGAAPFCVIPRLCGTQVWINPDGLEWARAKWSFAARVYFRFMEWAAIRVANRVIADAVSIADSLASRHGPLRSCSVISYGCDIAEDTPSTEPLLQWSLQAGDYYLIVCRLEPENNVLEMLRAFQDSKSRRQLIVVGDHRTRTRYVEKLVSIGDNRIRMVGTVFDRDQLTCLRCHAFAYLHGHSVGGTNPSLLEAMGCGNLIFAHDNSFNRETLGSSGLYFQDPVELTRAMDRSEAEPEAVVRLKEAAKNRARLRYRWPDVVSRYETLLDSLAFDESPEIV